jgi:hypothetical protein
VTSRAYRLLTVGDSLGGPSASAGSGSAPSPANAVPAGNDAPRPWQPKSPAGSCPHPRARPASSGGSPRAAATPGAAWRPSHHPIDATRPAAATIPVSGPVELPVPGVRLGRNAHDMDACMIPGASANPAVFLGAQGGTRAQYRRLAPSAEPLAGVWANSVCPRSRAGG